jgi:hypothetical protein
MKEKPKKSVSTIEAEKLWRAKTIIFSILAQPEFGIES